MLVAKQQADGQDADQKDGPERRPRLREAGFELIGSGAKTSPAVVTVALPESLNSVKIGEQMQEAGYLLSYNSRYLGRRNWIQVCFMGDCAKDKLVSMFNALKRACFRRQTVGAATELE